MSYFVTKLKVQWENEDDDDIPCWVLLEPLVYYSSLLGRSIAVPAGFVTDFASVPRAPVAYFLAGNRGNRAAVVHDYLIVSNEVPRATADEVFLEALLATNVDEWRARTMYLAVQSFTQSLSGWSESTEFPSISPQMEDK